MAVGLGLLGIALWLAASALVVYGLDPSSANVVAAPIGLQEMALAVWLTVREFAAFARASEPEEEPATDD